MALALNSLAAGVCGDSPDDRAAQVRGVVKDMLEKRAGKKGRGRRR